MDSLYLPYLRHNEPLQLALERMKETNSRAIVVDSYNTEIRLYMNRLVVEAITQGKLLCADIPQDQGMRIGTFDHPVDVSASNDLYLYQFIEQSLDKQQVSYGIPFFTRGTQAVVLVVTRHEDLANDIRKAAKVCMCEEKSHTYDSPPYLENSSCPVDGTRLECY